MKGSSALLVATPNEAIRAPWTIDEVAFLRERFALLGPKAISRSFPLRSIASIEHKAKRLGLSCPNTKTQPISSNGPLLAALDALLMGEASSLANINAIARHFDVTETGIRAFLKRTGRRPAWIAVAKPHRADPSDDAVIRQHYSHGGSHVVAALLPHLTHDRIRRRARQLRLRRAGRKLRSNCCDAPTASLGLDPNAAEQ